MSRDAAYHTEMPIASLSLEFVWSHSSCCCQFKPFIMSTPPGKAQFESTTSIDPEAAKPNLHPSRITFEPDDRLSRQGHASRSRSRSHSAGRNSISSIRRRSQSGAGIPIEFRTLSFEVAHSQSKQDIKTKNLRG